MKTPEIDALETIFILDIHALDSLNFRSKEV
ncbi:hypothetical protein NEOC65_001278 [Neochlamydia sp. AcF65]|nr:hypothetical protein [Neochlamydia sp. AcF65]